MRVLLVRHGESQSNVDKSLHKILPDHAIPLSENGRLQAQRAGVFLRKYLTEKKVQEVRIWTSPYKRTRGTAQEILKAFDQVPSLQGKPIYVTGKEIFADLREHVNLCEQHFGLFDGLSDDELKAQFPAEHAKYQRCVIHEGRFWAAMPLGESRFDVAVRVHEAFGTFHRDADRHGIDNIIVVCHGVTLRAFVMQWLHLTPEWFDGEANPGNCDVREILNGVDMGYFYADMGYFYAGSMP